MKKAVFFTSVFPFKTVGENFFESELEGVSREFDKVYIVACDMRESDPEIKKTLPKNVEAFSAQTELVKRSVFKGVFCLPFKPFFWSEISRIIKEKRPFMQAFKSLVYAGSSYLSICRRFPYIAKKIALEKGDDVVFVGYWLTYISRAILAFKKYTGFKKAPVISRAHGSADVRNIAQPRRFYPFQKYLVDNLDAVLAVSEGGSQYLKEMSAHPERIRRIYIGSYGPQKEIKRSREPFTVMTCSNIIMLKRVGLVGSAVRLLKKEIPDIKWVHFGDGPLREKLEREFADIEECVTFFGYTPHDEVLKYLESGKASVFVSASATEGLPVSIIEAAAHSLPAIATDVGSTCEIAVTGESGSLVPPDINAAELAKEILKYYKMSEKEYDEISQKAYSLFKKEFDCRENAVQFAKALVEA